MPTPSFHIAVMLDLGVGNQRHTDTFAGVHTYADEQKWQVTLDEFAHVTLAKHRSGPRPYDGVVGRVPAELEHQARRVGVPVVNVHRHRAAGAPLGNVFPDFVAIGELRAQHLLTRGFTRFGVLVPKDRGPVMEGTAFRREVREAGYPCAARIVPQWPAGSLRNWEATKEAIDACLNTWGTPIGLFVSNDAVTRLLLQTCQARGLRVPEDVAVISGWNENVWVERMEPTVTSVDMGYERVGYAAAKLLHRMMDGEPAPVSPVMLAPRGIVVRRSTDFFAVDDESVARGMAYIAAHAHEPIGCEDVAEAACVGVRSLQDRFRRVLGRPIAAEIRRVRLERARRELAQSKRSIAAIAQSCGFGPGPRLSENFRREFGITPSEYRRELESKRRSM